MKRFIEGPIASNMAKLAAYEKQMLATPDHRSQIPTVARWRRAGAARVWLVTTCRWRWKPSIT